VTEDALSRHLRRAGRILTRLGRPEAEWWGGAPRPKWMRHRTYGRLCAELVELQVAGEGMLEAETLRRFGGLV
jgi:hypothetical protein